MMLILQCCLIFTAIPLILCDQSSLTTPFPLDPIIHTLTRALQYFASHIDQVNLDAGIGTRIAADQLRSYASGRHFQSVKKLVDLSEYVTWKIVQSVRHRQPDYYTQLSFFLMPEIFSNLIPFQYRGNTYNLNMKNQCSLSPFIEKYSDQCLHALAFGQCNHTEACTKLMSDPHACRYSLSHQILYSIIAKKSLCSDHRLTSNDEHRLVSKMLVESQAIAQGNFLETDRDLFMEQITLGGLLGWNEFFENQNWFNTIINWQHPFEGCYGNDTNHQIKREEMQMPKQCLSHRTSVAIGALAQILRYLLSRDI